MYGKLHDQIFNSSIMETDLEIRYVWFCLIALADKEGFVDYTIEAIARRINLEADKVQEAIEKLCQPDPSSRSDDEGGKRLIPIRQSFGWKLTNYAYYRDLISQEERREYMRNYMKNYRSKQGVNKSKQPLTELTHTDTDVDTDADAKDSKASAKKPRSPRLSDDEWLKTIRNNKAYSHIDLDSELSKMDAWLSTRPGRVKTRRFIVNWLNKIEKPMGAKNGYKTRHQRNLENIRDFAEQHGCNDVLEGGGDTQRPLPAHGVGKR